MSELTEVQAVTMAANMNAETVREQQQEIQRLRNALGGEIGLVQLLVERPELRRDRAVILGNHRHVEALAALDGAPNDGDSDD